MWLANIGGASAAEARIPVVSRHLPSLALIALAPVAFSACAGRTNVAEAGGRCNEQIVLSLAPGFDRTDKVIKELSRGAQVRLDYLRSASPNLHVFRISSEGRDPECAAALARLRQDSRVRFAEPDARRVPFGAAR